MSLFMKWIIRYYNWKLRRAVKRTERIASKNMLKAEEKLKFKLIPAVELLNTMATEPISDETGEVNKYTIYKYNHKKLVRLANFCIEQFDELLAKRGEI